MGNINNHPYTIAYDAKRAFCNNTGLGNYSRSLIQMMIEQHQEINFILFTPQIKLQEFEKKISSFNNVRIVQPENYFFRLFPFLWRTFCISSLLKKFKPDIYHGLSHELPMGIEKINVRTIVTIHDLIAFKSENGFGWLNRLIYRNKIKSAVRRASQVIAVSQQTADELNKILKVSSAKIKVVYPFFKMDVLNNHFVESQTSIQSSLPEKFIFQVGRVEYRKNISAVIGALALIPSEDIHYVIAGRITSYKALLDRKIQSLSLTGRVHFLGEVSQQELYDLYQKSLMAIYPSLMEGFGFPVLEAIAMNKPVITNKGGCFEEVGGTIAWYSDTTNPNSIAAVIQEIINHPEKVMVKQKDTEIHLRKFSVPVILSQLLACYTEYNQA